MILITLCAMYQSIKWMVKSVKARNRQNKQNPQAEEEEEEGENEHKNHRAQATQRPKSVTNLRPDKKGQFSFNRQ